MISGTIWNQLVLTLQENETLAEYIKYVYEGRRFDLDEESFPCLMIEPVSDGEVFQHVNNVQKLYMTVNLFGFSSNNYHEFPKTIVGGQDYKGILDISNDVRGCLLSSATLGDNVIDTKIDTAQFDTLTDAKYPVRGFVMPLRILYQQQNGV